MLKIGTLSILSVSFLLGCANVPGGMGMQSMVPRGMGLQPVDAYPSLTCKQIADERVAIKREQDGANAAKNSGNGLASGFLGMAAMGLVGGRMSEAAPMMQNLAPSIMNATTAQMSQGPSPADAKAFSEKSELLDRYWALNKCG